MVSAVTAVNVRSMFNLYLVIEFKLTVYIGVEYVLSWIQVD